MGLWERLRDKYWDEYITQEDADRKRYRLQQPPLRRFAAGLYRLIANHGKFIAAGIAIIGAAIKFFG